MSNQHDGPYIVTVTTAERVRPDSPLREGIQTRRAVATLDEAREACIDAGHPRGMDGWKLPESGGTVGPLPDGTTIEVRETDAAELGTALGMSSHEVLSRTDDELVAAFNAAQEG